MTLKSSQLSAFSSQLPTDFECIQSRALDSLLNARKDASSASDPRNVTVSQVAVHSALLLTT